jgi:hypothetical protein
MARDKLETILTHIFGVKSPILSRTVLYLRYLVEEYDKIG